MQLDTGIHQIEPETKTPGVEKISPPPYRLNAYEQLWERLVNRLNGGSDESTEAVVEVGLLLAAGLYRVERAISVAADRGVDVVYEEPIETLTQGVKG